MNVKTSEVYVKLRNESYLTWVQPKIVVPTVIMSRTDKFA